MIGLIDSWDVEYNGTENEARFQLVCDSAYELSALTHYDSIKIRIGSECTDIATGDKYLKSSTAWVLQPSANQFENVYTKSEMDAIINQITAAQYLHNSTQVNLNDITWARSGGGLYYSQAIQIPDSPISKIYHATLSGFANIRETDMIVPAVRRSAGWAGFGLYANTNSFLSGAWVTVSVSGVR